MNKALLLLPALALLSAPSPAGSQERPIRARAGDHRIADTVKAGDPAPDFTLKTVDGKEAVTLSSFRGKTPVVLIFGSYT